MTIATLRRLGTVLLGFAMTASLCGCWSSVELNERAFARVMMLDKTKDGIELTLGFPLPNRISGGVTSGTSTSTEPPFALVTKTGRDIGEAYRLIQADLSRHITFGQLRNVLISKSFAQEGIYPIVDFLMRDPAVHINANLYVTDGPATQIGSIPLTFERFLTDILTAYAKQRTTLAITAKDVLMTTSYGGDFVVPMLVFGVIGAESERKGSHWMGTDGSAVFRHGKLVAQLDAKETRAAMWIKNEVDEGLMRIASPSDGKVISMMIDPSDTAIKPILNGNRIRFVISCKGSAKMIASESTLDVTNPDNIAKLELQVNRSLKDRLLRAVSQTQSQQADVFGFGQRIWWTQPRTWNRIKGDWRNLYQNQVTVEADVDIKIKSFGGALKPMWNIDLSEKEVGG